MIEVFLPEIIFLYRKLCDLNIKMGNTFVKDRNFGHFFSFCFASFFFFCSLLSATLFSFIITFSFSKLDLRVIIIGEV